MENFSECSVWAGRNCLQTSVRKRLCKRSRKLFSLALHFSTLLVLVLSVWRSLGSRCNWEECHLCLEGRSPAFFWSCISFHYCFVCPFSWRHSCAAVGLVCYRQRLAAPKVREVCSARGSGLKWLRVKSVDMSVKGLLETFVVFPCNREMKPFCSWSACFPPFCRVAWHVDPEEKILLRTGYCSWFEEKWH